MYLHIMFNIKTVQIVYIANAFSSDSTQYYGSCKIYRRNVGSSVLRVDKQL